MAASKKIGWTLSGLGSAFLAMDLTMKLAQVPQAAEASAPLGWDASTMLPLGITQLVCFVLYLVPRTSVLGAVLWTGYLGGAIATHARIGNPLFTHMLFPVYVAAFLWLGLWLREPRLQALLPIRRRE
jgi:hypothetical protein